MKVAVISSNFGNYDTFNEPSDKIKNINLFDWFFFTDNNKITSKVYKIINETYHFNETSKYNKNVMHAKYYKIQHHKIEELKGYNYVIWLDSSMVITNVNFVDDILKLLEQLPNMVSFSHSRRKNTKEEFTVLKKMKKFNGLNFDHQQNTYIKEGFKDDIGLFENGFFIRKIDEKMNKLFDDWWNEIKTHTYRDQVSFPYVLWKNNIKQDIIIKQNIFNCKLVGKVLKHK